MTGVTLYQNSVTLPKIYGMTFTERELFLIKNFKKWKVKNQQY